MKYKHNKKEPWSRDQKLVVVAIVTPIVTWLLDKIIK
jgi:hypothetical protein